MEMKISKKIGGKLMRRMMNNMIAYGVFQPKLCTSLIRFFLF